MKEPVEMLSPQAHKLLEHLHPYDALPPEVLAEVKGTAEEVTFTKGQEIYGYGVALDGLYIITEGKVTVHDANDMTVSSLGPGNSFGERGLMRDGLAVTCARTEEDTQLVCLPADLFHKLRSDQPAFAKFFERGAKRRDESPAPLSLSQVHVESLMVKDPVSCRPDLDLRTASEIVTAKRISCLTVVEDEAKLIGIVTLRDLVGKALAKGLPPTASISQIMTPDPISLSPSAIGSDVLHMMMEYHLGHVPIVEQDRLVGIVTQTDLTRFQATSAASLVGEAARAETVKDMAEITGRIPQLLAQLVNAGHRHDTVTRQITDVADVVTRRLLALAESKLGPAPARYLWLACGSQGRQEQTGVSDQDNCLILEDSAPPEAMAYFADFAQFVSDGLHACGYVYCPGDMMATNLRWCQPLATWKEYFRSWINSPSKEAQMLASVMFDLRPIGGDLSLFHTLKGDTLRRAATNSIFTAHMASNSVGHAPPLSLLRGLSTIRSGEHRDTLDMKHAGVVPVVDLGRMYALQRQLEHVNTRSRLEAAIAAGVVSTAGGRDLLDAYDLVAQTRLEHQAAQIKRGAAPDNFLPPNDLSGFDRSHLRDAFVVIKTMQSALMQGRGTLG